MAKKHLFTSLLLIISSASWADNSYVFAVTGAVTEDENTRYGISGFDTKGKGRWGLYGELLFDYDDGDYIYCDTECTDVSYKDKEMSFTVGGTYGFTDNLYALAGVGFRYNSLSTEPKNDSSVCDSSDVDGEVEPDDKEPRSGFCYDDSKYKAIGQIGLLYVTPFAVTIAGTYDTQETYSISLGYQF